MNADSEIRFACSEEFAELCAISVTGSLSDDESEMLDAHLLMCGKCRAVLADYESLASDGMARLASELNSGKGLGEEQPWAQAEAKDRILSLLRTDRPTDGEATPRAAGAVPFRPRFVPASLISNANEILAIAAVFVIAMLVGYQFGFRHGTSRGSTAPQGTGASSVELTDLQREREALNKKLALDSKTAADLNERAERDETELAELKDVKASLEKTTSQLSSTNEQQAGDLETVSAQRDQLEHRLEDAQQSLQIVRGDLNKLQDERQKALLRTASLETRIGELTADLKETSASSDRQKDFLASDRDIRELMGARQLYIADVFDVDHNGKKRKPFGRVFYTKGKSLIFYAFDLDEQPGPRDAKTYELWGSPNADQSSPVSLGIFYMDSEANRRWVFKSDDPNALAQINALFVTVEPNGDRKAPSGKPFLYTYLRAAPTNHP